eukprot:2886995-Rhodomonas_salina.2
MPVGIPTPKFARLYRATRNGRISYQGVLPGYPGTRIASYKASFVPGIFFVPCSPTGRDWNLRRGSPERRREQCVCVTCSRYAQVVNAKQ